MKYYKHPETGEVFAYENEQEREQWGAPELVEMTSEEIEAHLNPPRVEPVPQQVTRAQGKAALIQAGLWQGVLDYVSSIEDETQRALAEVALHDTLHWERSSPFLNAAASALGLADEQLDDLFRQAAEIVL
jgi:hypothetical protein